MWPHFVIDSGTYDFMTVEQCSHTKYTCSDFILSRAQVSSVLADKGCTGSHLNLHNLRLLSMILQLE
jgi:hypothetical protein